MIILNRLMILISFTLLLLCMLLPLRKLRTVPDSKRASFSQDARSPSRGLRNAPPDRFLYTRDPLRKQGGNDNRKNRMALPAHSSHSVSV